MEPQLFLRYFLMNPLKDALKDFKIVIPKAPTRNMTYHKKQMISWFDIKTYENAFTIPFDDAFSKADVEDSYQRLERIIKQELQLLNNDYQKLFIGGFSQGCGMSIYTAFRLPFNIGGVIGIAGYYFEITSYDNKRDIKMLIAHGNNDQIRPWEQVKISYDKDIGSQNVKIVENMAHEMDNYKVRLLIADFIKANL
ncbi:phospholipase carboxylesterase family protein, putative [Ichthyophthirius multifiliis]|uniref:Phospholipase carboxylesterase family protein, putative n=1 Tax=Ichthyophthirius multifiliis TaxID=5932 RepID=G0QUG1_ICHMU|nr:phospholipase carboxylesterase family protein, putative [Ichthyophthirius multifiliis]EGR31157.1 phospholipase carboxylesterase family protein, putative [Ichthyophthirius multifiliis]|eukprot:XP_004034643.1 phospholipase carboxylesterase family protein, putative [Ichthyophthirius multifiliis]